MVFVKIFPKHNFGTPILKKISDWVCLIALVLPTAYVITMWGEIPAQIPTHFNAAGVADAYGSKGTLGFLIFMMLFMYMVMKFASACPQMWNVGGITNNRRPKMSVKINPMSNNTPDYTDEQVERAYHLVADMLSWMNMTCMLMLGYMTIQSACGNELGILFLPLTLGAVVGSMIYYMWRIYKKNPHKMSDNG